MGKWLTLFLHEHQKVGPDTPDIMDSVSGMSGNGLKESVKNPISASPNAKPSPPVLPGWLITYGDHAGRLYGGSDAREHGTVRECYWQAGRWTVYLTDGQQVPLSLVRAVGQTDDSGRLCAAWTVREHGYDGKGRRPHISTIDCDFKVLMKVCDAA